MITVSKAASLPPFGVLKIAEVPERTTIETSQLGEIVREEILATPRHNPEIAILNHVVMPDHFHVLLFVSCRIKKHLGQIIQAMKASITSRCRRLLGNPVLEVLEKEYNDRIIMRKGQANAASDYIDENPYRLAVRKMHPEFFRRVNDIEIDGKRLQAYGNMLLLRNPFKMQVIVHRTDTQNILSAKRIQWLYNAANGGVLVSPFISKAEKAIREESESLNGHHILITMEPFEERYKPYGQNFKLCTEGRLLIISAAQAFRSERERTYMKEESPRKALTRAECIYLNEIAAKIAEI